MKASLILCLFLAGCVHESFAQIADRKCQSFGAKPGTDTYVKCRAQIDTSQAIGVYSLTH